MKQFLIFMLLISCFTLARSQNFERIAPQVASTTIVIDKNTSKKVLQDQALRAIKNTTSENYQATYLIIRSCLKTIQTSPGVLDISFQDTQGGKELKELIVSELTSDDNALYELLRLNLENEPFGQKAKQKAEKILDKWRHSKIKNIRKTIARKITALVDLGLTSSVVTSTYSDNLLKNLPAIIGLDIEEIDRVKALSEIIFSLQHFVEELRFIDNAGGLPLQVKLGNNALFSIESNTQGSLHTFILTLLDGFKDQLQPELINHLSAEDPAVKYFEIFFAKVRARVSHLGEEQQLESILTESILNISNDYLNLKTPVPGYRYLTRLGQTYSTKQYSTSLANDFIKHFIINTFIEILGDYTGTPLTEALKNPSRLAWLNNFSLNSETPELTTTIAYKILNRPRFTWELSTNAFFNKTTEEPVGDIKEDIGRRILIGSSIKFPWQTNKFEFAFNSAVSGMVIGNLSNLQTSAPDVYNGLSAAIKIREVIIRPYYEWEIQRLEEVRKDYHNAGAEFRLPEHFIVSGFFLNHKFNFGTTIGINFSVIK